jgi:hypothetical protein
MFKEKEWDFPKNHQLTHLFGDIRKKGSTSYLSCNVGEGFHQGLIEAYRASNKKNAAYQVGLCNPFGFISLRILQILRHESRKAAILRIHWRIDNERARRQQAEKEEDDTEPVINDGDEDDDEERSTVMTLMSPGCTKPVPAELIKQNHRFYNGFMGDAAFDQFDVKLCHFLQAEQAAMENKTVAEVEILLMHEITVRILILVRY